MEKGKPSIYLSHLAPEVLSVVTRAVTALTISSTTPPLFILAMRVSWAPLLDMNGGHNASRVFPSGGCSTDAGIIGAYGSSSRQCGVFFSNAMCILACAGVSASQRPIAGPAFILTTRQGLESAGTADLLR